jgi:small redox-active disulfide protein 2
MKTIKILGTGCPKCQRTTEITQEVVDELGMDARIEKVEDIMEIMKYDIMSTPAIVIDEKVTLKGRVPSKTELTELFKQEM